MLYKDIAMEPEKQQKLAEIGQYLLSIDTERRKVICDLLLAMAGSSAHKQPAVSPHDGEPEAPQSA